MSKLKDKKIFVGFGKDKWQNIRLFLHCLIKGYKICVFQPGLPEEVNRLMLKFKFFKKYKDSKIEICETALGDIKGKFYDASKHAIELNEKYWAQEDFPEKKIAQYFNSKFSTTKATFFFKKAVCEEIFIALKNLYQYELFRIENSKFLTLKTAIVDFSIANTSIIKNNEEYLSLRTSLGINKVLRYYLAFFNDVFLSRGFVFNLKKDKFKLAKEVAMGFSRPTLRDDLLIDGKIFKKEDILFLLLDSSDNQRSVAFEEAKQNCYSVEYLRKMPINFSSQFLNIFLFYLHSPLMVLMLCLLSNNAGLIFHSTKFLRRAFFFELLMLRYDIGFYISNTEQEDIVSTIVFNKYGTKTVFYNWSDVTVTPWYSLAYAAHNIYLAWGQLQYDRQYQLSGMDDVQFVGNTFKEAIKLEIGRKSETLESMSFENDQKIVTFCDNSFSNGIHMTEKLYVSFVNLIYEFAKTHQDVEVFLKPKNFKLSPYKVSRKYRVEFSLLIEQLLSLVNFHDLHPRHECLEKYIAISDVVINMAMNSPALLAIVSDKNALYYEPTGNNNHPFSEKFRDIVVFAEKDKLINKIDEILYRKEKVYKRIPEKLKEGMDAHRDTNAVNRIREYLDNLLVKETH